ncbi:MAG TPA: signal peptidase I [Acidobacteriaceae bacterium]|nr:signal peptidase I [Acidobacteriaceae bacterium]
MSGVEGEPVGVEKVAAQRRADVPAHGLLPSLRSILWVIVVGLFITAFTVQPFRIPSSSMEPTLLVGDFLMVDKQVGFADSSRLFAPAGEIRRGDVMIFRYPVDASMHLVKRVVGLPGDRLRMSGGKVYVNGVALTEPYAVYREAGENRYRDEFPMLESADPGVDSRWWVEMRSLVAGGELTVPAGRYFVLGDNRNDSEDSRYWGLVPRGAIVGRPLLVYFSLGGSGSMAGPAAVARASSQRATPGEKLGGLVRWDRVFRRVN